MQDFHSVKRLWVLAFVVGCSGGSDVPSAPPVIPPTSVVILSASGTTFRLKNNGGPGSYQLHVYGRSFSGGPSGCFTSELIEGHCPAFAVKLWEYEPVTVLAGYDETLTFTYTGGEVYGYKVYSRPVNSAVWAQTGCLKAVTGNWATFLCP